MKKEEFVEYIDGIQPDLYMKSRLKAKIETGRPNTLRLKKYLKCIAALCLAVVLVIVVSGNVSNEADNDDGTQASGILPDIMQAFIVVASASDAQGEVAVATKMLEVDEAYPYGVYFKTYDVTGMTEPQKYSLLKKMNNELADTYSGKEDFSFGRSSIVATDKIYMVICSMNEFRFNIQPNKTVKSINVKNTSAYGQMIFSSGKRDFSAALNGSDITVSGEEFDPMTAGFYWDYTDELVNVLEENPDTPFSVFNDAITFTLEYTDGSKQVGVVELNFDTDGNAAAVCKKYEHQKAGD